MSKFISKIKQWYSGWVEIHDGLQSDQNPSFTIKVHQPSTVKKILAPIIIYIVRHHQWIIIVALTATTLAYTIYGVMLAEYSLSQKTEISEKRSNK